MEYFKESNKVHACPAVATTQQREEWTHHTRDTVVTDTEDSDSDEEDSMMSLLIYPEYSNNDESWSNPPSVEPTHNPGPPSEKPTNEPTS